MNKATRMLAIAGMAAAAGATAGAGQAMASPSTPSVHQVSQAASVQADRSRIIAFYRNPIACALAARYGETHHRFLDFDCTRIRGGGHHGYYALTVTRDNRWDWGHG